MEKVLLEIDSSKRNMLLSKLGSVGLLAMKVYKQDGEERTFPTTNKMTFKPENDAYSKRQKVEIYAEPCSVGKIIKTIVKLGRDGFLNHSPVRVISVSSAA